MTPLPMTSFLQFNNVMLYCVPKLRLMGQKFSVREKMDISDLQVGGSRSPPLMPWKGYNFGRHNFDGPLCSSEVSGAASSEAPVY